jgi:hypothetical protein
MELFWTLFYKLLSWKFFRIREEFLGLGMRALDFRHKITPGRLFLKENQNSSLDPDSEKKWVY